MIKYYLTKIEVAKASCVPSLRDVAMPFFQYLATNFAPILSRPIM